MRSWLQPLWEPRVPPRFALDCAESAVLVDAMAELLDAMLAGTDPSETDWQRWSLALRRAAFGDRARGSSYGATWSGVGETERLEVALRGALAHAAVLVELRGVRMRD